MTCTALQLKDRARAYALEHDITVQEVLQNYMFERILVRLSDSEYSEKIILKGGLLISSLFGLKNRTTMDMDATIRNIKLDPQNLLEVLSTILKIDSSDNLKFEILGYQNIREEDQYGGLRIKVLAVLEMLRIHLSLDFSTDDIITPHPIQYSYPRLFETTPLSILAYPMESILAEKLHAVLDQYGAKGRMKDYYDLHHFVQIYCHSIAIPILKEAVNNTFSHRHSLELLGHSYEILNQISNSNILKKRWDLFSPKHSYSKNIAFPETVESISKLLILINK